MTPVRSFSPALARRAAFGVAAAVALANSAGAQRGAPPAAPKPASNISIPFEKYVLPNGLTVVLSQNRAVPTVDVIVMYHVGSKNEVVGRTGFAHLFEHVMFTGSGHVPYGEHDKYTEGVGGDNNGSTDNDITRYYETVPSNYLEHQLWLESDRMGFLLDALDTAKYNAQRDIVQNERRQSYDNQPYGRSSELIDSVMYPPTHPYHWQVIGSMKDLQAAPVDAVKEFFRLYYAPNNATLVIQGDFDVPTTKALVRKYFGDIARGKPFVRPTVPPVVMAAEKRIVYEDRVQVPRLYLTWPTVGVKSSDQYALDVLSAILAGPRTARLTKELVYDRQWVASIGAFQGTSEDAGQFQVAVTPRPGFTLTQIELATDSIIERIKRDGPTDDEVKRTKAGNEFAFVSGLEGRRTKAMLLAEGQTFFNDPSRGFTVDYPRAQAVTAADVKRVAAKYLTKGRVVLSIVPLGKKNEASKPELSISVGGGK